MTAKNPYGFPSDLPVPEDDGACRHLTGLRMPPVPLPSTLGDTIDLSRLSGTLVVYCYPREVPDGEAVPEGWDAIPGARGCTPQACSFRDHHRELESLGAKVFGLSTQGTESQREMVARLDLPYPILSDAALTFAKTLRLPTFTVESHTMIKRLTLIAVEGAVMKAFYSVFPPHRNPDDVIAWLRARAREETGERSLAGD